MQFTKKILTCGKFACMKASARNFGILFVLLSVLETVTLSLGVSSIRPCI